MFYKGNYFRIFKNIVGRGIVRGKHFLTEMFPPNISDKKFLRIIGCDADDIIKKSCHLSFLSLRIIGKL